MEFIVATPQRQPAPSEAGSAGSRHSEAEGLLGRLDVANAAIAALSLQLGEARAQLAARDAQFASAIELCKLTSKLDARDEKLAAQDEISALKDTISSMRLEWAQWEANNPRAQPVSGNASEAGSEAELLKVAPGLAAPTAQAPPRAYMRLKIWVPHQPRWRKPTTCQMLGRSPEHRRLAAPLPWEGS